MKKIGEAINHLGIDNNINASLKDDYIKSLKDDDFKELVSKISLTADDLMKYTSKLQECSVEYGHCKKCKGLVECKNQVTGFALIPMASSHRLTFSYNICHYNEELRIRNKYQDNAFYFDVPKEIRDAKISDIYTTDKKRLEIIEYIKDFIKEYRKDKKGKGLYISGNFGSGKTYLIAALFNELAKSGTRVAIIYWPEFLRTLKASFETDFEEKYEYIKKVPLLLIDDIGAENLTAWARDEILGPILQFRMQEGLSTFFTSNLNAEELENHFSITSNRIEKVKAKRIMERIKQLSIEMSLISKNNRQ
ncbi:MAG: primosomal protein DnaI [Bacilli bacterium]|jgi:primosomal protein DnaI